jgi:transposase
MPRSNRSVLTTGYANAIRDELPDAVAVLDAFHVVKLGTQVVDEVRGRIQQDTLGRRGHKDDPLYKIRGLLRRGREHLSEKQIVKLNTCLVAGDPGWEVTLAWHAYQQLRSMYQASTPAAGKRIAEQVIGSFPQCPIPEVARLGRTLKMCAATSWPGSRPTGSPTAAPRPSTCSSRRLAAWPGGIKRRLQRTR